LSGEKGARVTASAPQAAAEAADLDAGAVGVLHAGGAVAAPAVGEVEALGGLVAAEHPEDGVGIAGVVEAPPRVLEETAANAGAPAIGVDVEGVDLAGAPRVLVAGRAEGGEADDPLAGKGDGRLRVGGGRRVDVVPVDSLLRLQRVEELVVDQAAVGGLPGADVDARDVKTLVRPGSSD
jgi:hypothetical protein